MGKDGAARAKAITKKETVVKPVIAIDPDVVTHKSGAKAREASSKKTSKSLTAILTARSKVRLNSRYAYIHWHYIKTHFDDIGLPCL